MAALNAIVSRRSSMASALCRLPAALARCMSNVPENAIYGGPAPQSPAQRVTLTSLRQKHRRGEPITVVTAYDYPSAVHLDMAGVNVCLVCDSAAMVVHGHDTTLPNSLDEMLVHCRAVARGAKRPLLVGDVPFGSYESSSNQVVRFDVTSFPDSTNVLFEVVNEDGSCFACRCGVCVNAPLLL